MNLTSEQEAQVLSYITTQPNLDPLYDVGYHESKIARAQAFNPEFSRAEAWSLSMYLGPSYYCSGINRTLLKMSMPVEEKAKFEVIAEAAKIALSKVPSVTNEMLSNLPQPDARLPPAQYLKRFVYYPQEVLDSYEVGKVKREPNFSSTTFWQAPVGQMKQYAEKANTVFHVHVLSKQSWGQYIDQTKRSAREGEVLFPPGTDFQVTEKGTSRYPIDTAGNEQKQMNIINLQEVKRNVDEREL